MRRVLVMVVGLMLVAGCQLIEKLPGLPQDDTGPIILFGGTDSVHTKILNPRADAFAYEGYDFVPVLRLTNVGDYDNPEGKACITGLDRDVFNGFLGCECQQFPQESFFGEGFEWEDVTFPDYTVRLAENELEQDFTFTAITRFTYKTMAKAKLCIKQDLYSNDGCDVGLGGTDGVEKLKSTTSGPINIKSVKESLIPEGKDAATVILAIDIEKKSGEGSVIDRETLLGQCIPDKKPEGLVYGTVLNMPFAAMTCSPVKLDVGGEGVMKCTAKGVGLFETYEPVIDIELNYAYETRESVKFKVARN